MSNPAPRRFRFSLGFLLAWVLLTGALFGVAMVGMKQPPYFYTSDHPEIPEQIMHDKIHTSGWPVWAIRNVQRSFIVLPNEKDFMIPDAELASEQIAHVVRTIEFREYNPEGLAINLALCVLFSGLICLSVRYFIKRRAVLPISSPGKP